MHVTVKKMTMRLPIMMNATPVLTVTLSLACTLGPKTNADDTASLTTSSEVSNDAGQTATGSLAPTSEASTTSTSTSDVMPGTTVAASTFAEDTADFIVMLDMGPVFPNCDLVLQECPEGQKCNPSANDCSLIYCGQPICVPVVANPKPPGASCSTLGDALDGTDDCELGSVCLFPDDQGNGVCHQICGANYTDVPGCTTPGETCNHPGCQDCFWGWCEPPCDPRELDACEQGDVCIVSSSFFCFPDASGDEGQAGDACEFANGCDPGLRCTAPAQVPGCDPGWTGCCSPFCSTDQPNTCPNKDQGEVCVPVFTAEDDQPPEFANLGSCYLPP